MGVKWYFFYLALMNNTYLFIDVYCSNEVKKNKFSSTAAEACFLVFKELKNINTLI